MFGLLKNTAANLRRSQDWRGVWKKYRRISWMGSGRVSLQGVPTRDSRVSGIRRQELLSVPEGPHSLALSQLPRCGDPQLTGPAETWLGSEFQSRVPEKTGSAWVRYPRWCTMTMASRTHPQERKLATNVKVLKLRVCMYTCRLNTHTEQKNVGITKGHSVKTKYMCMFVRL